MSQWFMDLVSASRKHQAGSLSSIILLIIHQGVIRSSFFSEPGKHSTGITLDPQEWPMPVTSIQPLQLQQGQARHAAPQSPSGWEAAARFAPLCYLFSPAAGYADGEWGLQAPGSPPWFRKGSFSGNTFCKFPSTDDLRAF